ncbi:hypothetical protein SAY87_020354 [Trapa incisa]|uniref:Zinc beta-ribbon domain-containing protein n=1 Tax=Trapa incisa TaxID=236973 RepID=A0AAN7K7A2_9MYRT|nr:hypothetical protein SAY87_020354 [Trapa incisa]
MECNRDDALHAKEIAERKLMERDYAGARRFVLKAQNLFPTLEGLSDMQHTLDVYISAENKICGEADWYGILGVNLWDDDEANRSPGADGAFKLVLEAWNLLSDKSKRVTYNQKRNSRVVQQSSNGFYQNKRSKNFSNNRVNVPSAPSQHCQKNDTFWTICNQCKTHYEYLGVHLSHTLLCPDCKQAFYPAEKAPPSHDLKPSNSHSKQMTVLLGSSWLTSLLLAILTGQDIFIMVLQKGEEWKTVFIKHIILGLIKWVWEMEVIQKGIKPWEVCTI